MTKGRTHLCKKCELVVLRVRVEVCGDEALRLQSGDRHHRRQELLHVLRVGLRLEEEVEAVGHLLDACDGVGHAMLEQQLHQANKDVTHAMANKAKSIQYRLKETKTTSTNWK